MDFEALRAVRGGEEIALTPLELRLLEFFADREGRALSRAELLQGVWSEEAVSRVVDNTVMSLRRKLEPAPESPVHFVAVRGVGYRFDRSPTKAAEDEAG